MKAYEITFSPTGGTKKVSDIVMSAFAYDKEEISLLQETIDYSQYEFSKEDICVIAVPSYGGRVPKTAVERISSMKGNAARAVLVCVYGNRAFEDTLSELKDIVKRAGFFPVAAIAAVAEHSIMRQFAAGRPDLEDRLEIKKFAEAIREKIESGEMMAEVQVPGNKIYKEYSVSSSHPFATEECRECDICAKECPVGAIDKDYLKKTDESKCISCMRCVKVCPQRARGLDEQVLKSLTERLSKALETRKMNRLFL